MLGALSSSFPRPTRPSSLVSLRSSRAKVSHARTMTNMRTRARSWAGKLSRGPESWLLSSGAAHETCLARCLIHNK